MKPLTAKQKKIYEKGYMKGESNKESELAPIHKKAMGKLEAEKDLVIVEKEADIRSMKMKLSYWQDYFKKAMKNEIKNKLDRKELQQIAEDLQYFIDQKVIENENVVSAIGEVLEKFTGKPRLKLK